MPLEQSEKVEKLFSDAEFYLKREKFAQAQEVYQEILKLEPTNKSAARGLERAEKGLQAREAKPSQITLLAPIDQTPTSFRGKSKLSGKRLWLGGAAVVLIGVVVSAWFLWFRTNSQIPPMPSGTRLGFQKADTAKQEMLKAKTEAEQADAERWAPETYQRASDDEQRGDNEFLNGNFEPARQAYNAATQNFGNSTEEARRNTALNTASLNVLKDEVAKVMQAMSNEKILAEKLGAKIKAKELFDMALAKAEEGAKALIGVIARLFAAQKFYAEPETALRKPARKRHLQNLQTRPEWQKEMDVTKQQISGRK
jgi:tetratricopeptide (TPR) repeat protein